jgi:S1-C subfamily serine protease
MKKGLAQGFLIAFSTLLSGFGFTNSANAQSAYTDFYIEETAKRITINIQYPSSIYSEDEYVGNGSGVLVRGKNNQYYVLTNAHVVDVPAEYFARFDNLNIPVKLTLKKKNRYQEGEPDLALLNFHSQPKTDQINYSPTTPGERVFISGFPTSSENENFKVTRSKIISRQGNSIFYLPLEDDSNAEKGMSGGPILNNNAELVGIHEQQVSPDEDVKKRRGIPVDVILSSFKDELGGRIRLW